MFLVLDSAEPAPSLRKHFICCAQAYHRCRDTVISAILHSYKKGNNMSEYIYVLGMDGRPQMPTRRKRHIDRLLSTGKAKVVEYVPFTVQLLYENHPVLQPVILAEDPGRTNIGVAAVSQKGELLFSAVVETRNKEITKFMEKRRKASQRLAKRCHTMIKAGQVMRKLPMFGEEKYITCRYIRNTESRFCNRRRKDGWLTPSAEQLVRTHINLVHRIQGFLPVTDVALEVNRFAFMQLEDPYITGVDFQNGPLKGYDDRKAAVYDQQDGQCLLCNKKPIEHYHHIVPVAKRGSDTLANIAGLCCRCHEKVHKDARAARRLQNKKQGLTKKYGALSVLNQAIPFICKRLEEEFGEHVHYCSGRDTSRLRQSFGFHKTKDEPLHEVDAWCIGVLSLREIPEKCPDFTKVYQIKQFRRQNRRRINHQTERRYYLDGKLVAVNRKKRMGQTGRKDNQTKDSLADWFTKMVHLYREKEAEHLRSRLTVKKSQHSYNDLKREMPGAEFIYENQRYILSGQLTNGKYYRAVGSTQNFPAAKCRIRRHNRGLVFVS